MEIILKNKDNKEVSIIMGSQSDWETMKNCSQILDSFKVAYDTKIISAHRTPERLFKFSKSAISKKTKIIIAGAGGAAHLPGMVASLTQLPVLAVPVESKFLNGLDSLLSIVQMPYGIPTATFAIGKPGAKNAALFAISILALNNNALSKKLYTWRKEQTKNVALNPS